MMNKSRLALIAALGLIALAPAAAGCGNDEQLAVSGNATDAAFVTDMIAHHQGAIEMAHIAERRAEHAEIRRLAEEIVAAQEREIATMRSLRAELPEGGGKMGMSDAEMGMDMSPKMLEGAEPFDEAFIDMMVPHHEGAIAMAKRLQSEGEHAGLQRMAGEIIAAQAREIAQMRKWRKLWYGSSDTSGHGAMHEDG